MGQEYKTHLFFYDDNSFEFLRRGMLASCLVEKAGDFLKRGWKHFYGSQLPFPGYKRIHSALVTLGFSRDIILDPFNAVPSGQGLAEKPNTKEKDAMKKWIANIAENRRFILRGKRKSQVWTNRITWAFLGVMTVEVFVWLFLMLKANYG